MIEELKAELPDISALEVQRPRVASEHFVIAFVSALGAGFIAGGIADLARAALWPVFFPPTQPHPGWLEPFAIARAVEMIAIAAVALRAGGLLSLGVCVLYEAALIITRVPGQIAFCARVGPQPDASLAIPCDPISFATAMWPTWLGLAIGAVLASRLLPAPIGGANTVLRAAGAFSLTLTAAGTAFGLAQMTVLSGFPGHPASDPVAISYYVAVDMTFLVVNLVAGLLAGKLLARAPAAAVVLLALLVIHAIGFGITLMRTQSESGALPMEFLFLQSSSVLMPAAGVFGIAIGRLLARRNLLVTRM